MVPSPRTCIHKSGAFRLTDSVSIVCEDDQASTRTLADRLRNRLKQRTGLALTESTGSPGDDPHIRLVDLSRSGNAPEDYALTVSRNEVTVEGAYSGLLYGVEALCQLINREGETWEWPCVEVRDGPAFQWRGLMLDCSRHFLSTRFLLRCIDIMPALRLNRLHLHLTDDHGWRMQVHAFPDLTDVGGFVETEAGRQGFYTQDELRQIVDYAGERNIMVIPEIEVPGHAYAAMRSYPWLCCTGEPTRNPGHQKDLYCAGKESTFDFLEKVLSEVVTVFPAPYVHIGGDEAPKDRWRDCAACRQRIRREGLADEVELQAYMIQRCAAFLRSRGRRTIGWEEILDGNPDNDALVQWWRYRSHGDRAIRDALARGHSVISSPNSFCYLSFPVSPDEHFAENRTSDLRKVYGAELVPTDLPPEQRERLLGAECCIWTEYLTEDDIIPMLFPRAIACAELMWYAPESRDYDSFLAEVLSTEAYWNSIGVSYGPYSRDETDRADASDES